MGKGVEGEKVSGTFFLPKRAALVKKAEDGPWSSVYARRYGNEKGGKGVRYLLSSFR
jgi:hypothetical protein